MAALPVCPLLSMRSSEQTELCLAEACALYLPAPQKCSLVFLGYRAFVELQRLQQAPRPGEPNNNT